ncbi:metallophosphoesterase family protein [Sneathiella sp. HT1-7]|uniref:metallophosphoesterase family protein n=1 Tax=Sneathiella sp. HT1-7 TaxID=2887192 RepID=UPI001D15377B|nr:metallophosphoesterase family protein [Sneathiella sp. HT1-7]MCC3303867.1 serine/threonine protein phosphatase [Sneathiella sp. HT1-7]
MPLARLNKFISRRSVEECETEPSSLVSVGAAKMPDGHRAYVIGDIHGRKDLLSSLLERIAADQAQRKEMAAHLIFLGDYVDRGPDSSGVLDMLIELKKSDMNVITLKGNHESAMTSFLQGPMRGKRWLHYGGDATLRSYGIDLPLAAMTEEKIREAGKKLKKNLPDSHLQFISSLEASYMMGDYLFVHAGIEPDRALDDQKEHDLLWIRDEFLEHTGLFDKVIVHGHSIIPEPEFKENRIGIDTGAFYSNILTCLVLEGESKEIL